MRRFRKYLAAFLTAALTLTLSGCYSGNIDQYFSLPQPADEFLQLQELIDQEIAQGSEYAAPTGGSYRQSIQLYDLDGNGTEEALAFFRSENQQLRIRIYALQGKDYRPVLTLQGDGTSIGSIEYTDLNGDSLPELLVAWQISTGMRMLTVYDLSGWGGDTLLTTDCSEFIVFDLDQNTRNELLVLRPNGTGSYVVDMHRFERNSDPSVVSVGLSADIAGLQRIRTVSIEQSHPALLVESGCDNGDLVSDLIVFNRGELRNLTCNASTGRSQTRRSYSIYATDIDGDKATEIPSPNQLYSQAEGTFWSVTWKNYSSDGTVETGHTSYHSFADGWYLILPRGWEAGLTIRRDDSISGERAVIISRLNTDGSINDLLVIYTITGENRVNRAEIAGRFVLTKDDSTVYAAKILGGVTEDEVRNNFHIIYSEWST